MRAAVLGMQVSYMKLFEIGNARGTLLDSERKSGSVCLSVDTSTIY